MAKPLQKMAYCFLFWFQHLMLNKMLFFGRCLADIVLKYQRQFNPSKCASNALFFLCLLGLHCLLFITPTPWKAIDILNTCILICLGPPHVWMVDIEDLDEVKKIVEGVVNGPDVSILFSLWI